MCILTNDQNHPDRWRPALNFCHKAQTHLQENGSTSVWPEKRWVGGSGSCSPEWYSCKPWLARSWSSLLWWLSKDLFEWRKCWGSKVTQSQGSRRSSGFSSSNGRRINMLKMLKMMMYCYPKDFNPDESCPPRGFWIFKSWRQIWIQHQLHFQMFDFLLPGR